MASIREKLSSKKTKLADQREATKDHPAILHDFQNGAFYQVEIETINADPKQPRQFFDQDALAELSESIRQKGVLQPVIIRQDNDTKQIFLVAGERRFRAAKMAGLTKIPAIFSTGNPAEISLIENLQRENLKPLEEAEALSRMISEYKYKQEALAQVLGKAKSTVSEILSINRLPDEIKNELKSDVRRAELFPRRLLIEIAKEKTPDAMFSLFNLVKTGKLKSDQVRSLTRNKKTSDTPSPSILTKKKINSLIGYLQKIDIQAIEKDEQVEIISDLHKLKQLLDDLLK